MSLMLTGQQLTGALTAETSGSMGIIIICAIAGVVIGLVLAVIFVRRRCHTLVQPDEKGAAASTVTAEWAVEMASSTVTAEWAVELASSTVTAEWAVEMASSTVTAEWAVEMATPEPKLAVATEVEHSKLEDASGGGTSARTSSTGGHVPRLETELRPSTCKLPPTSQADKDKEVCDIALTI